MAATPMFFGTFNMNDNINYFLIEKDMLSATPIQQTLYKIGRLEGKKKTGEDIAEKTITCKLKVIGVSRADLEAKVDTLQQALDLRQQSLSLHTGDTRYWIADCIERQIPLGVGNVLNTTATLKFLCQQPFAYAQNASSSSIANQTLTIVSGSTYQWPLKTITGGGTVFSRPTITITSSSAVAWQQIQINQQTDNVFVTITSQLPTTTNDFVTIICDPYANNGVTITKNNGTVLAQFQGPLASLVQEPTATKWYLTVNAPSAPAGSVSFSWTPRWLS